MALNYLGATSGADRAIKQVVPLIDDFRFGSAYSTLTGRTEPQLTVGKRLTNDIRASVTAGLSEDRELRSNIEWRLNNRLSVQGSYDNINDASSSTLGQPRHRPSLATRVRVAVKKGAMRERSGYRGRAAPCGAQLLVLTLMLEALSAHAQGIVPIQPTPHTAQESALPTLAPPTDLSGLAGEPITRVSVVLEGNVWRDIGIPTVHDVKPGETLTPDAARRALAELLRTGQFARARATATAEKGGAALVLYVAPRKLVLRLELDLHGARVDCDELMRETNLTEGGEIVGADIGETAARVARYLALHGYPAARVDIQTRTSDD